MRITSFRTEPITEIPFLNAGKGPGSFSVAHLPIHVGQVTGLPEDVDAIIATSDLQGRERLQDGIGGPPRLLGEVLPEQLAREVLPALGISPHRTGVILAGDFYTVPNLDQRGGSGDVRSVWQEFSCQFQWVAGVAGNHDMFGSSVDPSTRLAANAHYLDGESALIHDIRIAGIGGIVGNPRKPHRKTDEEFANHIKNLVSDAPDILIMHDGPVGSDRGQRGSQVIRNLLEQRPATLLVRGHAHWNVATAELANGTQVLNVDCRVAILQR